MYHRFDENKYPSTNIRMGDFKEHIYTIKNEGIEFVNPKDFHYFDGVWRSYELRGAITEASRATKAGRQ